MSDFKNTLSLNGTPVSVAGHIHPASSISNTPAGNIISIDVQAAINELDQEKSSEINFQNLLSKVNRFSSITFISTNSSLDDTQYIILASNTISINLPSAINKSGIQYLIKNIGTGQITINPISPETIDGNNSFLMVSPNSAIFLISSNINWQIF